jgi:hypothetical protein
VGAPGGASGLVQYSTSRGTSYRDPMEEEEKEKEEEQQQKLKYILFCQTVFLCTNRT